jgi:hypothetical protein
MRQQPRKLELAPITTVRCKSCDDLAQQLEKLKLELAKERGLTTHLRQELETEKAANVRLRAASKIPQKKKNFLVSDADHQQASSRIGHVVSQPDGGNPALIAQLKASQKEVAQEQEANSRLQAEITRQQEEVEELREMGEQERKDCELQKAAVGMFRDRMQGKIKLQAKLQQKERYITQQTILNLREQLAKAEQLANATANAKANAILAPLYVEAPATVQVPAKPVTHSQCAIPKPKQIVNPTAAKSQSNMKEANDGVDAVKNSLAGVQTQVREMAERAAPAETTPQAITDADRMAIRKKKVPYCPRKC